MYEFSNGGRSKYVAWLIQSAHFVVLNSDVATVYRDRRSGSARASAPALRREAATKDLAKRLHG